MSLLNLELDGNTIFFYNFKKYYRKSVYVLLTCIYYIEKYIFQELEVNLIYNNFYIRSVLVGLFYLQYFLLKFM